ncbi:Lyso-phosphatidylcholine acyltransferase [Balamuthia mandrillaris]
MEDKESKGKPQKKSPLAVDGLQLGRDRTWLGSGVGEDRADLWRRAFNATVVSVCASLSKAITNLEYITVYHGERMEEYMYKRPAGQGLITVFNHISEVDDPGALAPLVSWKSLWEYDSIRWTFVAKDILFESKLWATLFTGLKALPVERGGSVDQHYLQEGVDKLNKGQWVSLFPEGRLCLPHETCPLPFRLGLARLASSPLLTPLIVPIYHEGLREVKTPEQLVPRFFKEVCLFPPSLLLSSVVLHYSCFICR